MGFGPEEVSLYLIGYRTRDVLPADITVMSCPVLASTRFYWLTRLRGGGGHTVRFSVALPVPLSRLCLVRGHSRLLLNLYPFICDILYPSYSTLSCAVETTSSTNILPRDEMCVGFTPAERGTARTGFTGAASPSEFPDSPHPRSHQLPFYANVRQVWFNLSLMRR